MIEAYRRLIEWVDRPAVLVRLGIAFVASWMIFLWQIRALDYFPPDYIDKGIYYLQAFGHTLGMPVFRSVFPWLVAAQLLGVVLIALRTVPIACLALVVIPLFWPWLVWVSYPLGQ